LNINSFKSIKTRILNTMFENIREDWRTYQGQISRQGIWIMWIYRFGQWRYTTRIRWLQMPFSFLYKILFVFIQIITGVKLSGEAKVRKRFIIEHTGCIYRS
jgi:serine O-acetyltransferase